MTKDTDPKLVDKITQRVYNQTINEMFFDLDKLRKMEMELSIKVLLDKANEEEKKRLKAMRIILGHHRIGGRISDLTKYNKKNER